MPEDHSALPSLNAALLLADGRIFYGQAIGATGAVFGEICFNTAMTGYQEVLTDPSYNGQIITFTFPHIGNVGCNEEDIESGMRENSNPSGLPDFPTPRLHMGACGLVIREPITNPSSFRSAGHLNEWLIKKKISGICGVDTRALTRHIRKFGAQNAVIISQDKPLTAAHTEEAKKKLEKHPSLNGMELAKAVSTRKNYEWQEPRWSLTLDKKQPETSFHVVAIDYGEKLNILRCLTSFGCEVTVVPAGATAEDILSLKPDGVFLSNGPGDPAATGRYAVPVIQKMIDIGLPVFGICLGHQMLALALGGKTEKMHQGHRGANHPVKNLETGRVEITSQNHGFVVREDSLPKNVIVTHRSLFDGSVEGMRLKGKPVFSVQYHPESSPGPHDSMYLFEEFVNVMSKRAEAA